MAIKKTPIIAAAIIEISESHIASQEAVYLKLRNVLLTDHNFKSVHDARGALSLSRFSPAFTFMCHSELCATWKLW